MRCTVAKGGWGVFFISIWVVFANAGWLLVASKFTAEGISSIQSRLFCVEEQDMQPKHWLSYIAVKLCQHICGVWIRCAASSLPPNHSWIWYITFHWTRISSCRLSQLGPRGFELLVPTICATAWVRTPVAQLELKLTQVEPRLIYSCGFSRRDFLWSVTELRLFRPASSYLRIRLCIL